MYEELHGDLEEFYYERLADLGKSRADWLYVRDVIRCCQPYSWKNWNGHSNSNIGMLKNFYFTALRSMLRHKSYFAINMVGLAIGIASFTFIALYVTNELSYDRFYPEYENLYRVSNRAVINGIPNQSAPTASPMAQTLLSDYPEVRKATRLFRSGSLLVGNGERKINEDNVFFAHESMPEVFGLELIHGDSKTALVRPRSMILSEDYARKYFGNLNPVGQSLTVEEDTIFYKITGVFKALPANSHLRFDMVGSISSNKKWNQDRWVGGSQHTYVLLEEGVDVDHLEDKMRNIFYERMAPQIEYFTGLKIEEWEAAGAGNSVRFALVPIADIHLKSDYAEELEPTGSILYIYIYSLIGAALLFIAIFNFVNLATAHSVSRAKEVGVRKVIGSTKRHLIYQFIFESTLISSFSTLIAAIMVKTMEGPFQILVGRDLGFSLTSSYHWSLFLLLLALLVGVLSGAYPAFVLSSFQPATVLKGRLKASGNGGWVRNVLVTLQFAASVAIIIGTVVIYRQVDHMVNKSLGFDKEQILTIKRADLLGNRMKVFKEDLLANPNIKVVANSETIPGKPYAIRSYRTPEDPKTYLFRHNQVTYEHQQLMGFEMLDGRFFSKEFGADSAGVVINQAAAEAFGFADPVGKKLNSAFRQGETLTILGVMSDYHIESLHQPIAPVTLELVPEASGFVNVKLTSGKNVRETVEVIDALWKKQVGNKPLQYFFVDQDYQNLYRSETATGNLLLVFSSLSVFIACIGLIGLVAYAASVRRKEIGIRKVLGASTLALVRLLSHEITRLILLAIIIGWPVAYFGANQWLQNYADRVQVDPWMFIISTLVLILVVAVAIGYQTMKSALSNPVDSLKQE